jgi:hypothetical protein
MRLKDKPVAYEQFGIPILGKVPVSKVTKRFTQYRKAASILYFYAPELRSEQNDNDKNDSEITSSSEILIVDRIRSKSDYTELLSRAISIVEKEQTTLRKPYRLRRKKLVKGAEKGDIASPFLTHSAPPLRRS